MDIETYQRKTFPVNAVQVTEENLLEVSEWCGGEILEQKTKIKNATKIENFIKVPVKNPLNEKQTRAYIGDWVLEADENYKVYTDRAFSKSFEKVKVYTEADAQNHLDDNPADVVEDSSSLV